MPPDTCSVHLVGADVAVRQPGRHVGMQAVRRWGGWLDSSRCCETGEIHRIDWVPRNMNINITSFSKKITNNTHSKSNYCILCTIFTSWLYSAAMYNADISKNNTTSTPYEPMAMVVFQQVELRASEMGDGR